MLETGYDRRGKCKSKYYYGNSKKDWDLDHECSDIREMVGGEF
jgi:hypothetical protein